MAYDYAKIFGFGFLIILYIGCATASAALLAKKTENDTEKTFGITFAVISAIIELILVIIYGIYVYKYYREY